MMLDAGCRVAIVGLGGVFRCLEATLFRDYKVVALCDNDPSKQGSIYNSLQINSCEQMQLDGWDFILITSMFSKEIANIFLSRGVPQSKIVLFNQIYPALGLERFDTTSFKAKIEQKWAAIDSPVKRARLLFVINSMVCGGVEQALLSLLSVLDENRYEVVLVVLFPHGELLSRIPSWVKVLGLFDQESERIEAMLYLSSEPSPRLYDTLIRRRFDLEISFIEGLSVRILAGHPKKGAVAWIHTDFESDHWTHPYFDSTEERVCFNSFRQIVFVSKNVRESFSRFFDMPAASMNPVIYNIVDSQHIKTLAEKPIPLDVSLITVPIILLVGRLHPIKGFERMLAIHARLLARGLEHKLWIVGDGVLSEKLKTEIKRLKIEDSTLMLGFQDNPYAWMNRADICVSASYAESFGLTMIEACFLGKAVVATQTAGSAEVLLDRRHGLVENSDEALFQAIADLLTYPRLIECRASVAEDVTSRFSSEQLISELNEFIDNSLIRFSGEAR
ncbi:glycosyltransferase [Rheinheimera soli]|uniref:glycosyltransferase n=1 Tax=Rheinheimera soli TaxID=443616 RepID=UPI001E2ED8C4|nr:glycosyltransferase [Rheinheimera soli]